MLHLGIEGACPKGAPKRCSLPYAMVGKKVFREQTGSGSRKSMEQPRKSGGPLFCKGPGGRGGLGGGGGRYIRQGTAPWGGGNARKRIEAGSSLRG